MRGFTFGLFLLVLLFKVNAQDTIQLVSQLKFNTSVKPDVISYRGLSVVNNKVVWVSGSKGSFAKSIDGGKSFIIQQISGYEKADFRAIEAFDANNAIIMSSGTPAVILKTTNGGNSWSKVFHQSDSAYFLDAISFWDSKHGLVVGDPIDGVFLILETNDGGLTWQQRPKEKSFPAKANESLFAASGTCLLTLPKNTFTMVTGGEACRLITGKLYNNKVHWQSTDLPIIRGNSASGAFSVAKYKQQLMVVGGNYNLDKADSATYCLFNQNRLLPLNGKIGYASSVTYLNPNQWLACGTSGVYWYNQGWQTISSQGFHVAKKAKKGKLMVLAGSKGRIATVNLKLK